MTNIKYSREEGTGTPETARHFTMRNNNAEGPSFGGFGDVSSMMAASDGMATMMMMGQNSMNNGGDFKGAWGRTLSEDLVIYESRMFTNCYKIGVLYAKSDQYAENDMYNNGNYFLTYPHVVLCWRCVVLVLYGAWCGVLCCGCAMLWYDVIWSGTVVIVLFCLWSRCWWCAVMVWIVALHVVLCCMLRKVVG